MKKKVILSSALAIALSASIAVGGTFALFTSESEVNVAITSGKVEVVATVSDLATYSAQATGAEDSTFTDENGATYKHVSTGGGSFANGGTAAISGGNTLTLNKITPGDKVTFNINVANNSNVAIQYRVKLACEEGIMLFSALDFTVGGENFTRVRSYISAWSALAVGHNPATVAVEIALPMNTGNAYQNLSTSIVYTVEAVQGNAATTNESYRETIANELVEVATAAAFTEAVENGKDVVLTAPVQLPEVVEVKGDFGVYGEGENAKLVVPDAADRVVNATATTEPLTVTLVGVDVEGPTSGTYTRGISFYDNDDVTLVMDDCSVSANYYAINIGSANDNVEVVIKNTTVTGWAAFQTWSAGTKATFENCTLIGNNDKAYNADGWNNFATVVINADATNTELTFTNCRFEANQTTGNDQDLLSVRAHGAKVTLTNCTYFANGSEIENLGAYLSIYYADLVLTIDGLVIPIG